ncbi:DUF6232 family protein [Pseudosporangium ferrugineum]|uniref:Uncharacterized protein n=1 Tax=Pseudosporangium ferrugineum TaxID=439699 RepID=A0A2T0S7S0_9ACTN|nr:DUF6232 family protein [Pseudosporangium ferrugineum]PRY29462.1 hypothetical protein CLV70_106181 [Pseudosporangium ferrugineum]
MRVYYRGPDAMVTSEHFVHRTTTTTKAFLVRDLRNVCIASADGVRPHYALLGVGAALALVTVWPLGKVSPLYAIAFLGLVGFGMAATALLWRARPRTWVLQATYRGQAVDLYGAVDARVFNQVSRALRRAIEDARPPSSWDDNAAA